jgi:CelD/BcsL family acetyltransferase involved in cellulose biosynthesis
MPGEPRRLALLGAGLADYDDVLLDADLAARGTALFARELAAWRDEWDACAIDELRPDSPLLDVPFPSTIRAERAPSSVCPVISLPAPLGAGATVAALEPAMSPSHRRKLRLSHNRLERAGGGTFAYAGEHDWQAVFDTLIRLHEHRWRDRGEPGVLADPRVREMHREIVPAFLARGCLRLAGLWLDRELVAVLYGVAWHGRTYCYLQGIAPHAAYYSPGVALLRFVIEQAIAEGGHEVDLLRGAESYKYLWGATDRRNHALHLEPAVSSPPSRSPAPATLGDKELL